MPAIATPAPPLPAPPAAPAVSVRRLRIALGTWLAIEATATSEGLGLAAIEAAFAAVSEVERCMHPERTGSDLQRISSAEPGVATRVSPATSQVLSFAQRLHQLSDGVFDPCLPVKAGRLSDVELRHTQPGSAAAEDGPQAACAVVCRSPVALDFGGIAKGYAIDRAVEALRDAGCSAGLVNGGGDLRLFGAHRERILLRHADGRHQLLWLKDTALAVSDLEARGRPQQHRGYYVRTGVPAAARRHAAVLAHDAMTADALTKCVLLCPPESAMRLLRECGGRTAPSLRD